MATLDEALSLAIDHHRAGRLAEAKHIYDQILAAVPDHAATNRLLGVLAAQVGRFAVAARYLVRAVLLDPADAPGWLNLGGAQRGLKQLAAAERSLGRALALDPTSADAWNNLGGVVHLRGDFAAAVELLTHAAGLAPRHPGILTGLGAAQRDAGDVAGSIATLRGAVALEPDAAEPHWALSVSLLAAGQLDEGWREFEWRRRRPGYELPDPAVPRWQGEPLAGRHLLLHSEQGRGDTLQFARFAVRLAERGERVTLSCQPDLVDLLSTLPGVTVVPEKALPSDIDLHCPLLSLPALLATRYDRLPGTGAYLKADPGRLEAWRARLGAGPGLRVGLVWAGNPAYPLDHLRSPGLAAVRPLLAVPGLAWHVLQVGEGRRDLTSAPLPDGVADLGPALRDFADTAAVMALMDVVVSSDTATAHLAAALGRDTRVLVSALPDFRWAGRPDGRSVWYDSARLYRQRRVLDWEEPVARLAADLAVRTP
jgi:Flp pilus assembly protein TadD